jgi:prepilin-type N-terminal cleavage/methylation domain-containing protein
MKAKKAFTLIELLIVIAIIAILALIAVPNFLEAQVRAKVSRVYSDIRTVAVAIEVYTVDWGRPIIGINEGSIGNAANLNLWPKKEGYRCYYALTTPVAYISSVPTDPFIKTDQAGVRKEWKVFAYQIGSDRMVREGYNWLIYSPGPDGDTDPPWFYEMLRDGHPNNVYDASNGTMSNGSIWWTNQGKFFAPK